MLHRPDFLATIALTGAIFLAVGRTSPAVVTWVGDESAFWGNPDNWFPSMVPGSNDDVEIGAPAPTIVETVLRQANEMDVLEDGEIEIVGGITLSVTGGRLTNNGLITVNSDGVASASMLTMPSGGTLDGTGEVVLAEPGSLSQINSPAGTITQGGDHTLRGEGWLRASFTNNGTVIAEDADGDLSGELLISTGTIVNNNIIRSSPTASINVATAITQGVGGRLIADADNIEAYAITISGGTLESTGGGKFQFFRNAVVLIDVHNLGTIEGVISPGFSPTIRIDGAGLTNDGTITTPVNALPGGGNVSFLTSGILGGTGELILNREGLGAQLGGGATITQASTHTIRGVGIVSAPIINNGTIIAEPRDGTILTFNSNGKTNNNLIRADAGATLEISGTTVTQDDNTGRMVANEGTVNLKGNSVISGGRLETVGAGTFEVVASSRLEDLTNDGIVNVPAGGTLTLGGSSVTNDGTITVHSSGSGFVHLNILADLALNGIGEVVLAFGTDARLNISAGATLTQAAGHTLRGVGQINGPGTLISNGRVEGNSDTDLIEINGRIGGAGTLKHVRIDGTHAPGASTAITLLEGVYSVTNFSGRLEIEIGGTTPGSGYDQLKSTDPSNQILIGTSNTVLNVSFLEPYAPVGGETFTVITTAGTITGGFDKINLPPLDPGLVWLQPNQTATELTLSIMATSLADFDQDGDVDGDDLDAFEDCASGPRIPLTPGCEDKDFDADNDVDQSDAGIMQRCFSGENIPSDPSCPG